MFQSGPQVVLLALEAVVRDVQMLQGTAALKDLLHKKWALPYPLVMTNIAVENCHVKWENPL